MLIKICIKLKEKVRLWKQMAIWLAYVADTTSRGNRTENCMKVKP